MDTSRILQAAHGMGLLTVDSLTAELHAFDCPKTSRGYVHRLLTGRAALDDTEWAAVCSHLGIDGLAKVCGALASPEAAQPEEDVLHVAIRTTRDAATLADEAVDAVDPRSPAGSALSLSERQALHERVRTMRGRLDHLDRLLVRARVEAA